MAVALLCGVACIAGPPAPGPPPEWQLAWGQCGNSDPYGYNYVGWNSQSREQCAIRATSLAENNEPGIVLGFNHNWYSGECRLLVAWWIGKRGRPLHPPAPPPPGTTWDFESLTSSNISVNPPSHSYAGTIGQWVCGWSHECLYPPPHARYCRPPGLPSVVPIPSPTQFRPQPACKCDPKISTPGLGNWYCASRTKETSDGRSCTPIINPGEHCNDGELKCSHGAPHNEYPPPGKQCGCQQYLNGTGESDVILCVEEEPHGNVCSLADSEGQCSAIPNSTICTMRKIFRVPVLVPVTQPVRDLQNELGTASNVTFNEIAINSICPDVACPNMTCPPTVQLRKQDGCVFEPPEDMTLMLGDSLVVDFDIELNGEVDRSDKAEALFQNVDLVANGIPAENSEMRALIFLSVTTIDSVNPPAVRTYGPSPPSDDSGSSHEYWWVAVVAGCSFVVVIAGVVVKKVRFSEQVDFSASRVNVQRGLEGCCRSHSRQRGRGNSLLTQSTAYNVNSSFVSAEESELCVDDVTTYLLPVTDRIVFRQSMPPVMPRPESIRSRSDSSGSSEPEMVI
eukprot:TRINITY_DN23952_c0_g1_i1.p1 TRINITY_DN23952_c0_g1~~TRINITY_DN23952_c0_g1_i1.p1  ORF type:complete len:566 (+),score=57.06 TRINITY_DN23952_c0_g1_i1:98-1795(+)